MAELAIEQRACTHCRKNFPLESLQNHGEDCDFCPACAATWRDAFNACAHDFTPHRDEMGDPGHLCRRCSGFVADPS